MLGMIDGMSVDVLNSLLAVLPTETPGEALHIKVTSDALFVDRVQDGEVVGSFFMDKGDLIDNTSDEEDED